MSVEETEPVCTRTFVTGGLEDRLLRHVYALSHEIGNRNVEHYCGLEQACSYITQELQGLGYKVEFQEYEVQDCAGDWMPVRNIIVDKQGREKSDEIVLLGAHYDSCFHPAGNPGADDNASSVAGLLELARLLKEKSTQRTIRFVAFVNEEPPFFMTPQMGSAVYVRHARLSGERIHVAIILEMIGFFSDDPSMQDYSSIGSWASMLHGKFPKRADYLIGFGDQHSLPALKQIAAHYNRHSSVRMVTNHGFGFLSDTLAGLCNSDNLSFWSEGYKAVMLSDTAYMRNRNYHQPTDTYDTLHYEHFAEVIRGVSGALLNY